MTTPDYFSGPGRDAPPDPRATDGRRRADCHALSPTRCPHMGRGRKARQRGNVTPLEI
jgi:hypothetical protein